MDSKSSTIEESQIPVTAVISRRVRAGCQKAFEEWLQGISQAVAQFPGHHGVSILRPRDPANFDYVITLKFDSAAHLRQWLRSDARREWIRNSDPRTEKADNVTELAGHEPWFTTSGQGIRRDGPDAFGSAPRTGDEPDRPRARQDRPARHLTRRRP
ncbi:MAG: antibiotic biosynthesis monooxygenase [Candidatus Brocadiia bacterium]|jgi:antibiotic biosynthesis monooxygenase (ABM) superfamily enzyme